jgi:hypothetical protein
MQVRARLEIPNAKTQIPNKLQSSKEEIELTARLDGVSPYQSSSPNFTGRATLCGAGMMVPDFLHCGLAHSKSG